MASCCAKRPDQITNREREHTVSARSAGFVLPGWPLMIRGGGDPSQNMVIEPFVRMGPLPRSLAAEANDCFMVRLPRGATEYKVAARSSRTMAGSPRIVGDQPGPCR
jgi:hypothetical protein